MKPGPPNGGAPRWLPRPWLSAVVLACWLLLQGSPALVNWLWGGLLAWLLPWLASDFIAAPATPVRGVGTMLRLAARVLADIVVANLSVARLVLSPWRQPRPSWVQVRHGLRDPRAVALLASIITITPGTVSCVVDEERGLILVHALDAPDPLAVADDILARYARPLEEIFG